MVYGNSLCGKINLVLERDVMNNEFLQCGKPTSLAGEF